MCKPFAQWPFYCDWDDGGGLNGEAVFIGPFLVFAKRNLMNIAFENA